MKKQTWINIDAEKITETEKAICLSVNISASGSQAHEYRQWVPKSCYRVIDQKPYKLQQIKSWFYYKEQLYKIFGN